LPDRLGGGVRYHPVDEEAGSQEQKHAQSDDRYLQFPLFPPMVIVPA
jgi:hypothetical protein